MTRLRCLALCLVVASAVRVHEFVALAPATAGAVAGPATLEWLELAYDTEAASVADVAAAFKTLDAAQPSPVDQWLGVDLKAGGGAGAALAAKHLDGKLYVLMEVRGAPAGASGGCCADTLRVYGAAGANDVNLDALLDGIFAEDAPWHHATHTFDVYLLDGRPHAMLQVQYSDARLDGTKVNALVVVNVESNMVVPTVDGDLYFSISDHLGTRSLVYRETVYKVQYFNASTEEWHGNGVLRFEAADGTRLVALTHRFYQEAFVIKDPWAYGAADGGGGEMLQRFGTAPFYNAADNETAARRFHRFGLPASAAQFTGGVHNVFYTRNSTTAALRGRETLTLFVNSIQGLASSWVYELALRLSPEAALACPPSDAAFDTDFVAVRCGFEAQAMGGARVIANGVYLAASGAASTAAVSGVFELLDLQGGRIDLQYPGALGRRTSLYDTFATVVD